MWTLIPLCFVFIAVSFGQDACVYNGVTYNNGDSFPSTDGCNNCFCSGGGVACTLKFCLPSPVMTCSYGNDTYHVGEHFKSLDGCNTCMCDKNGQVSCTEMACMTTVAP